MVPLIGFARQDEGRIRGLIDRFRDDGYALHELHDVRRFAVAGYQGRVDTVPSPCRSRLTTTMYLAVCHRFTIAHELAHVSDMSVRRAETIDHIGAGMPNEWHLAHRMSSEYYANRIATLFTDEDEVFPAFTNDLNGLKGALGRGDWPGLLIDYALILGIFHGLGRRDCDPLALLGTGLELPQAVAAGAAAFRDHAPEFFAEYKT